MGYHERRAGGKGERQVERSGRATIPEGAAGPRIGPRSQVEIHKRPRRLVASCAQLQRCVARPCGTLHGKQQGRTAALRGAGWGPAPAPIRLGLFWFSLDALLSPRLAMHIAPLGEGRLPLPPEPGPWTCQ